MSKETQTSVGDQVGERMASSGCSDFHSKLRQVMSNNVREFKGKTTSCCSVFRAVDTEDANSYILT